MTRASEESELPGAEFEDSTTVRFGVLGPLEATVGDTEVRLGAPKLRAVLGVLVANRRSVVSTDQLIDALWGAEVAPNRQNALWVHVSNLRKTLKPEVEPAAPMPEILKTVAPGYTLNSEAIEVDADVFERLLVEGRALVDSDPAAASIVLAEALALWRGPAYADFTYEPWAQADISRLEELRLEAVETRIDADLRRGAARHIIGELEGLVRLHPTRERLAGSLMLALHRAGRAPEALRVYQGLRGRLAEDSGIEPSAVLQRLEHQIVVADPTLDDAREGGDTGLSVRGYEIRHRIAKTATGALYQAFQPAIGREVVIKVNGAELADDPVFVRDFDRLAQAIARLEHPHVVPLYDYWREPGAAYLVLRQVTGHTLAARIESGPLPSSELARLVDHVGAALAATHRSGLAHGDINTDNILIDDAGHAYLTGFDMATAKLDGAAKLDEAPGGVVAVTTSTHRADVAAFADVVAQAATGRSGDITDLLVGLDGRLAELLSSAHDVTDATPLALDAAALRSSVMEVLSGERAGPPTVVDENPYKGLRSFSTADAPDFFGRERFVERLVARLGRGGPMGRFVAVVGPSGSGKSSVVKAGLIPALRGNAAPGSSDWFAIEMVPGRSPFDQLESALLGVAVRPPSSLFEQMQGNRAIQRAVDRVLPSPDSTLVIVVDQFEELFTQTAPDEAVRFLDALVDATTDEHGRIRFVVTLRADFYDRPLRHRGVGELLRNGTELLTPMSPEDVERAISGPAERVGAVCDPALTSELITAVVDRPAALPLLQYTLAELFERRSGNRLEINAYRKMGGVSGALVQRAEAIFQSLHPDEQRAAREVFLRLVTVGDGVGDTRRRVLMSDLLSLGEGRHVARITEQFGRHRLLGFDRDPVSRGATVEIAHEAMITAWERLGGWIEESRLDVHAERRLAEAATEWINHASDPAFLMVGNRLARFDGWLTEPPVGLTAEQRDFLQLSGVAEAERRAARDAERERSAALRRRSKVLVAMAAIMALVVALGSVAFIQQRRASDLASEIELMTQARAIAATSRAVGSSDPELAVMLAIEAARVTSDQGEVTPEAMDALHAAIYASRVAYPADTGPAVFRSAAGGGVFLMPPNELIALAQGAVSRGLTAEECQAAALRDCSDPRDSMPSGLVIAGGADAYAGGIIDRPLAGSRVKITQPNTLDIDGLQAEFGAFTDRTGIIVDVEGARTDQGAQQVDVLRGDEDITIGPQPGYLQNIAGVQRGIPAMDVSAYLDRDVLEQTYGSYLTSLVSIGADGSWPSSAGPVYGVWTSLMPKSLLWYATELTDTLEGGVPDTWDDMISASDEFVDNGISPWCLTIDDSLAPGWPATDLLESVVLRSAGPEVYDAWVNHDIAFDHPDVVAAANQAGEILFADGYLAGGSAVAARTSWFEGPFSLTASPPQCAFTSLPAFLPVVVGPESMQNVAVTDFPTIDPDFAEWRIGGGEFAIAITDRPEVRAVMEFIVSPEFGSARASAGIGFVPPSIGFDLDKISNPTDQLVANMIRRSLEAGAFRFDASDLMPAQVGQGSFWFGMVDWFDGGPQSTERVLAEIDRSWPGSNDAALDGLPVGEIIEPGSYELDSLGVPVTMNIEGEWRIQYNQAGHTALSHPNPDSNRPGDRDLVLLRPTLLADPTRPQAQIGEQVPWPLDDIDGWLENVIDGVVTETPPTQVMVGDRTATYFEVEVSDQAICGAFGFCVGFIINQIFPDPVGLSGWSFEPGFRHRVWWIDGGDEPPLVLLANTRSDQTDFEIEADQLIDGLVIGEVGPHPSATE